MARREKNNVALERHETEDGHDIRILRRRSRSDDWMCESEFSEKQARDLHALLGDIFLID